MESVWKIFENCFMWFVVIFWILCMYCCCLSMFLDVFGISLFKFFKIKDGVNKNRIIVVSDLYKLVVNFWLVWVYRLISNELIISLRVVFSFLLFFKSFLSKLEKVSKFILYKLEIFVKFKIKLVMIFIVVFIVGSDIKVKINIK